MKARLAAAHALRFACGTFGTSLAALPSAKTVLDVKVQVSVLPVAAWTACIGFLIAFSVLWGMTTLPSLRRSR